MPNSTIPKRSVVANIITLVAVLAIVACVSAGTRQRKDWLYDARFSEKDIRDICEVLSIEGISYEKTDDLSILIELSKLRAARVAVAMAGLPHDGLIRRAKIASQVEEVNGKSVMERKEARRQRLEGEITVCLRQMPGVRDAQVQLAMPTKGYFISDRPKATALVLLALDSEHPLSDQSLRGMHHLVEGSVPELSPENIAIRDTEGRELTPQVYPHEPTEPRASERSNRPREK